MGVPPAKLHEKLASWERRNREGRWDSGEVEAVCLFDLEHARSARISGRPSSPSGAAIARAPAWEYLLACSPLRPRRSMMAYRIAAVDVHKKMLAVVVADVAGEGQYQFERRKFGATPGELHVLAQWLDQREVEEVVMESTAQYWKPVWGTLERYWKPARQKREGASQMCGPRLLL